MSIYILVPFHSSKSLHQSLRHISNVPQAKGWEKKIAEGPPCVVLASPGFMDVGPSRELFELWAPDSRNGLIITGYSIEGTLARVSHIPSCIIKIKKNRVHTLHSNGHIVFPPPRLSSSGTESSTINPSSYHSGNHA